MNLVDVYITHIIAGPDRDEDGNWFVIVATNCYGAKGERIFEAAFPEDLEKYKPGYFWCE